MKICQSEKMNEVKMKTLNKAKFMQSVGLLGARLKYDQTNEQDGRVNVRFEKSWYLILRSKLILLINVSEISRICLSALFEREDIVQLYIGSV